MIAEILSQWHLVTVGFSPMRSLDQVDIGEKMPSTIDLVQIYICSNTDSEHTLFINISK